MADPSQLTDAMEFGETQPYHVAEATSLTLDPL
jgi:hypothetical protein